MQRSVQASHPRSTIVSPGSIGPRLNGFPIAAADSQTTAGSALAIARRIRGCERYPFHDPSQNLSRDAALVHCRRRTQSCDLAGRIHGNLRRTAAASHVFQSEPPWVGGRASQSFWVDRSAAGYAGRGADRRWVRSPVSRHHGHASRRVCVVNGRAPSGSLG